MSLGHEELEVAKDLIKELRKTRESKERIQLEEIDARDRVDISLTMYEEMRNKIQEYYEESKKLKEENDKLIDIFKQLGFPVELLDKIENVTVSVSDGVAEEAGKVKYRIEFTVDKSEVEF